MDEVGEFLSELDLADSKVEIDDTTRQAHADDVGTTIEEAVMPDAVVYPESTDDVGTVLQAANVHQIPVTPYAAGTSLEGNPVPVEGGISLDLTRMSTILDVRPSSFQVDVQPGVMGSAIEEALADHGLFFPPLPSSGKISTIGGMIANDASGMQTVKYGEIRDWVLGLEVVLADGRVITTGGRAIKSSCGYNLTELFTGSEGTLGVITQATLEVAPRPAQIRGGRVLFPSLRQTTAAIADCVQSGLDVAKIELMDDQSAEMANAYLGTDLPSTPMVFLEFHAEHGIEEEIAFGRTILQEHDPMQISLGDESEMDALWEARKQLAFALIAYDPDLEPLHPGDVTVPIDRYSEMIEFIQELRDTHEILIPCFGHGGDGNVHYSVMVESGDEEHIRLGEELSREIVERALELRGTATGEHGVGRGKQDYLLEEHGREAVDVMWSIKQKMDPNEILNPGKIFAPEVRT